MRHAGLLQRRRLAYACHAAGVLTLLGATCAGLALLAHSRWELLLAVPLGIAFTQVAFLGHDGGHQQVFASRRANDRFGRLAGDLLVGVSYGWWLGKHNLHHANPNKEEHDPDIGDGVLAFTTGQAQRRSSTIGKIFLRRQAWLFFPLLTLEGLYLHVASVRSLFPRAVRSRRGGHRGLEGALLVTHVVLYVGGLLLVMSPLSALAFVALHQAIFGVYMGCSFAPNHKGMLVIGANEQIDYLRRQVLTSRNVRGSWAVDLLLGGLNYQIEHHLFPNMPRFALRPAQRMVREYCGQQQIVYTETSLLGSYRAALSYLNELGRGAA